MGDTYESVSVDVKDNVAQVTLVGPGKGNAMGPAFWAEMPEVFAKLDADRDVRAIVLTGSGKNFSYGLDLMAMGGTLSSVLADGATARPRSGDPMTVRSIAVLECGADAKASALRGHASTWARIARIRRARLGCDACSSNCADQRRGTWLIA